MRSFRRPYGSKMFVYAIFAFVIIGANSCQRFYMSNNELVPQSMVGSASNSNDKALERAENTKAKQQEDTMNWRPHSRHTNILGTELEVCSRSPLTGYTRTGYCETNE